MSLAIIMDSGLDVSEQMYEDIRVLPITVTFGDKEYADGSTLSHYHFYELLIESDELPRSSQVSPFAFSNAIKEALTTHDEALVLTMSSGLSGTYQSACMAAEEFGDKVRVVDTLNVCIGARILVDLAVELRAAGKTKEEIAWAVESERGNIRVLALLDTLEYLKKGGRISAAKALAGNLLSLKPVIEVRDGVVELLGTARGSKKGNNFLNDKIAADGGIDFSKPFYLGYSGLNDALLQKYIQDSAHIYEDEYHEPMRIMTIGCAIGTHVGPGTITIGYVAKNK